jgi:lipopolysaccharide export system permease protein
MNLIWQRYIFRETTRLFLFFLACFYFLYAMIDYSTHMQDFMVNKQIQILHVFNYYSLMFIKRADLLVPLSALIASIKHLLSMMTNGELVALQASGISLKRIASPLILLCAICTSLSYFSFECLLPSSLNFLDRFREKHFKHVPDKDRSEPVHAIHLEDGSKIIYETRDSENNHFFDVFWVYSSDEIWRMKTLSCNLSTPIGSYVDHIQRNKQGNLIKTESFETFAFPPFKWQSDLTGKGYIPMENRKISELIDLLNNTNQRMTSVERPQILTHLLFKCMMPLLPLLALIAIFPYCVRYSRSTSTFSIYTAAIFSFVAFGAIMDASVILGENQVVSPWIAICGPFLICTLGFGWKFIRT